MIGEHTDGTHAELIAVPETNVFPLADAISFETAAAFPLVYETAFRMLVTRSAAQAGRVGADLGDRRRRRDCGVRDRPRDRREDARHLRLGGQARTAREWGADVAVTPRRGASAAAKELGGVDLVVETVGEATWKDSLAAVKPGGRVAVCGATSGPNPPAQLHRFWWKQLTVYGSTMGTREDFLGAYELVRTGRARVHIDSTFPLSEIRAAHERLEAGEQLGKIVLTIPAG